MLVVFVGSGFRAFVAASTQEFEDHYVNHQEFQTET